MVLRELPSPPVSGISLAFLADSCFLYSFVAERYDIIFLQVMWNIFHNGDVFELSHDEEWRWDNCTVLGSVDGIGRWSIFVLCTRICISSYSCICVASPPLHFLQILASHILLWESGGWHCIVLGGNDARQRDCDMLAGIPQWAAGQYWHLYLYF